MLVELRAGLYGMNVNSLLSLVFSLASPCGIGSVGRWLKDALTGLRMFLLYMSVVIREVLLREFECQDPRFLLSL